MLPTRQLSIQEQMAINQNADITVRHNQLVDRIAMLERKIDQLVDLMSTKPVSKKTESKAE